MNGLLGIINPLIEKRKWAMRFFFLSFFYYMLFFAINFLLSDNIIAESEVFILQCTLYVLMAIHFIIMLSLMIYAGKKGKKIDRLCALHQKDVRTEMQFKETQKIVPENMQT